MTLHTFALGLLGANCYLLENDGHALVIDPSGNPEKLLGFLRERGLTLDAICLTHIHYDHIGALRPLAEATGAPVYLHPADDAIEASMARGLMTAHLPYGDTLSAAGLTLEVFHTPGHSPGSVCLRLGELLFTGDTLFAGTCGRTDLPGGDWSAMLASLRRISHLSDEATILPGHGSAASLAAERRDNPYLREALA